MTDYASNFTEVRFSPGDGGVYRWRGWTIYWSHDPRQGELYNPDGLHVISGDNFEDLAREATQHEDGQ